MVKEHLLFVHAWSGCDTTSSTFGKRKRTFSNMLNKSEELKLESQILSNPLSTQEEVGNAAINTFKVVYGGKKEDSLTKMRYNKYMDMICKGLIETQNICLFSWITSASASY